MSKSNHQETDLSFRNRTDEEKIESLTEKYGPDTEIGRLARNVLEELRSQEGQTDA